MTSGLFFILAMGILNRLRGWGPADAWLADHPGGIPPLRLRILSYATSKYVTSAYCGALTGGCAAWLGYGSPLAICIGTVIWLGMMLWAVPGWGDYWDGSPKPNQEVGVIDRLAGRIFPPGFWNDWFSMSLRGLLFGYPMFIWLAIMQANPFPLAVGLGMFLQGTVYAAAWKAIKNPKWRIPVAECLMGMVIGRLIHTAAFF